MGEATTQNTIRIPLELSRRLDERAKETGQTKNQILVAALAAYLDR